MKFILIIWIASAQVGASIEKIEFKNLKDCEFVAKEMNEERHVNATCFALVP